MNPSPSRVSVHTDGGARGNPGPAASGVVVVSAEGDVLHEEGLYLGRATNNVAEYRALLAGLAAAERLGAGEVDVYSDSELLVRQMNGQYRVKNEGLKPLAAEAKQRVDRFARCDIHHIRREANQRADALVNQALDLKRNVGHAADSNAP